VGSARAHVAERALETSAPRGFGAANARVRVYVRRFRGVLAEDEKRQKS
jgi:hypothetical protein